MLREQYVRAFLKALRLDFKKENKFHLSSAKWICYKVLQTIAGIVSVEAGAFGEGLKLNIKGKR